MEEMLRLLKELEAARKKHEAEADASLRDVERQMKEARELVGGMDDETGKVLSVSLDAMMGIVQAVAKTDDPDEAVVRLHRVADDINKAFPRN